LKGIAKTNYCRRQEKYSLDLVKAFIAFPLLKLRISFLNYLNVKMSRPIGRKALAVFLNRACSHHS
jgi:hypothetical protein